MTRQVKLDPLQLSKEDKSALELVAAHWLTTRFKYAHVRGDVKSLAQLLQQVCYKARRRGVSQERTDAGRRLERTRKKMSRLGIGVGENEGDKTG